VTALVLAFAVAWCFLRVDVGRVMVPISLNARSAEVSSTEEGLFSGGGVLGMTLSDIEVIII